MNKQEYLDLLKFYLKDLPKPVIDDIITDIGEHFEMGKETGKSEEEISSELGSPQTIADDYLENEGYSKPGYKSQIIRQREDFSNAENYSGIESGSYYQNYDSSSNGSYYKNDELKRKYSREFTIDSNSPLWKKVLIWIGIITFILIFGLPILGVLLGLLGGLIGLFVGILVFILAIFVTAIAFIFAGVISPFNILGLTEHFYLFNFPLYSLSMPTRILSALTMIILGILIIKAVIFLVKLSIKGIKKATIYIKWKINKRRENR